MIRKNALRAMKAARYPAVTFISDRVTSTSSGYGLTGVLSVAGTERSVALEVAVRDEGDVWRLASDTPIVQTAYGVKPYSGLFGALRVGDSVTVRFEAAIPKSAVVR